MASYPTSVKTFTTKNPGDKIASADVDDLQAEVTAIEAGLLNGTANLNSSNSTLANLSVAGGSTLAGALQVSGNSTLAGSLQVTGNSTFASSTIAIGGLPYIFPTAGGSSGQVMAIGSTSGSTMTLAWRTPSITLLHEADGSDSNASAATVDSFAVTGLTAKDRLIIHYYFESVTQQTANVVLYDTTDAVSLISLSNSAAVGAGNQDDGTARICQRQGNAANWFVGVNGSVAGASYGAGSGPSGLTAWTGSWTLGLRHGGVTAGGTFKYNWAVYKFSGQ